MNVLSRVALVTVFAFSGLCSPAVAQHYDSSHHHHDAMGHRVDDAGHHINNYGEHTGSYGVYDNHYYTPYHYVQPSYIQRSYVQPSYVNPGNYIAPTTTYRPAYSVPSNQLPFAGTTPTLRSGGDIIITSPANVGQEIKYVLGDTEFSMKPGYKQKFKDDREWVIAFGSGGSRGDVRYTLGPGTYQFKVTDEGWDLARVKTSQATTVLKPPAPPSE